MKLRRRGVMFGLWLAAGWPLLVGCGGGVTTGAKPKEAPVDHGSAPSAEASPAETSETPKADAASAEPGVPKQCAETNPCRPPKKWVERLCQDIHPGLALYMFQSGQPWERIYLRGRTSAINASGGATMEGWLEFDEEVLVLRMSRADPNGMQVSGATESYDALRWDGSCVTLSGGEVTSRVPPSPKSAFVTWRALDPNVQEALKENDTVREGYRLRQKECKGATMGEVTAACEKADKRLGQVISQQVRAGAKIPLPTKLP